MGVFDFITFSFWSCLLLFRTFLGIFLNVWMQIDPVEVFWRSKLSLYCIVWKDSVGLVAFTSFGKLTRLLGDCRTGCIPTKTWSRFWRIISETSRISTKSYYPPSCSLRSHLTSPTPALPLSCTLNICLKHPLVTQNCFAHWFKKSFVTALTSNLSLISKLMGKFTYISSVWFRLFWNDTFTFFVGLTKDFILYIFDSVSFASCFYASLISFCFFCSIERRTCFGENTFFCMNLEKLICLVRVAAFGRWVLLVLGFWIVDFTIGLGGENGSVARVCDPWWSSWGSELLCFLLSRFKGVLSSVLARLERFCLCLASAPLRYTLGSRSISSSILAFLNFAFMLPSMLASTYCRLLV